jgi:hypothetical protein
MLPEPWNIAALLAITYLSEACASLAASVGLDPAHRRQRDFVLLLFAIADWSFRRRFRNFLVTGKWSWSCW